MQGEGFSKAGLRWVPALGLLLAAPAAWATAQGSGPDWFAMGMALVGGLALFLYGMEMMADALKAAAGEQMKVILARLTTRPVMGAITGAAVTAVIQSSSVTTVLVVGFVTANLMTLSQAVGVIMGANVGTTITAQIVAFKVTHYAMLMIGVGFGMFFFVRQEQVVHYGRMLMGLGLVFFGMGIMGDAMYPLRGYEPFLELLRGMRNPLLGIAVAAAFTALVQSSSATTGIVIVMASQGLIPIETGIALIFGANVGTCVTAMLAAIGKPREAVRASVVHVLFNILGVAVWFFLIGPLAEVVAWMSPVAAEGLSAQDRLAAEVPRQIANAHTVFNVANTLLFIGFTGPIARLVHVLVPDRPVTGVVEVKPKFLDPLLLGTPAMALQAVRHEVARMGARVDDLLHEIMPAVLHGDRRRLRQIADMDNEVDALHGFIIRYLGEVSKANLNDQQTRELLRLMEAVNDLENIGDVIETNLVRLGERRIEESVQISERTGRVLGELHAAVSEAYRLALEAVTGQDREKAHAVLARKDAIARMMDRALLHQAQRLVADEPGRLAAYTIEIDITEKLKRIYYHARRMAKAVVPQEADKAAAAEPASA